MLQSLYCVLDLNTKTTRNWSVKPLLIWFQPTKRIFTNFTSALLQTVANSMVLKGICFISLYQLMVLISDRRLNTNIPKHTSYCQPKTNSAGILFFEYTTQHSFAKNHFRINSEEHEQPQLKTVKLTVYSHLLITTVPFPPSAQQNTDIQSLKTKNKFLINATHWSQEILLVYHLYSLHLQVSKERNEKRIGPQWDGKVTHWSNRRGLSCSDCM